MDDQLTTCERMEHVLGQIREYAGQHGLSPDQVRAVFEAGAFAAQRLGVFGPDPSSSADQKAA